MPFRAPRCLLAVASLALVATACATSKGTTTPVSAAAPVVTPAAEQKARGCRLAMEQNIGRVETLPPAQRLAPGVELLVASCGETLGKLGEVAATVAGKPRTERAAALAAVASEALPAACQATDPLAPASTLTWSCPPPAGLTLDEHLLGDLDAGTYLWVMAARARLDGVDALTTPATRVLDSLLLAAALEGEAAAAAAAPVKKGKKER